MEPLGSNLFITPLILQPDGLTDHSNSIIDRIFSNAFDLDIISGKLTASISDHLPQFRLIPSMFDNISVNKPDIYERDWPKCDWENFFLDYFSVDWEDMLKTDELNPDNSTKMYLQNIFLYINVNIKQQVN